MHTHTLVIDGEVSEVSAQPLRSGQTKSVITVKYRGRKTKQNKQNIKKTDRNTFGKGNPKLKCGTTKLVVSVSVS